MALELRQAPRVAVDLLRRRRRHALGLLLLSRGPAAREAAREGLLRPERGPRDQASRGADEEARERHPFQAHGVANKNLAVSGLVRSTIEPPLDFVAAVQREVVNMSSCASCPTVIITRAARKRRRAAFGCE